MEDNESLTAYLHISDRLENIYMVNTLTARKYVICAELMMKF